MVDKVEGMQRLLFTKRRAGLANEPYHNRLLLLNLESLEYWWLTQGHVSGY
jgi:hypothetical protein